MQYDDINDWPPYEDIPRRNIETVYSFGHYDGPATGLIKWRGMYWYAHRFETFDNRYWIIELTSEQRKYAKWYGQEWAYLFNSGMSWTPNGDHVPRKAGIYEPNLDEHRDVYKRWNREHESPKPDPEAEVVGYFIGWRYDAE
jgi:hypothetical protein